MISTAVCDQVQYKNSYLNRVKKQSTMIKPTGWVGRFVDGFF